MIKKILKTVSNILISALVVLEVICLLIVSIEKISGKNPSLFGYTISIIATPSMEGTLDVGDAIISKLYDSSMELEEGMIVSYQGLEGSYSGKIITHELIEIDDSKDITEYHFKGTQNETEDPIVYEEQILSIYVTKSYVVSLIYKATSSLIGFILLVIVPISLIFVDELVDLIKTAKKEVMKDEKDIQE